MIALAALLQLAGLGVLAMTMHATPREWRVASHHLRRAVAGGRAMLLLSFGLMAVAVGVSRVPLYWFGLLPVTAGCVLAVLSRVRQRTAR